MTPEDDETSRFSYASIIGAAFGAIMILVAILFGTTNYAAFVSIEGPRQHNWPGSS